MSCCDCLRSEFHYSKLCFYYRDWRAFAFTPWLPQRWQVQLLFLIYRWFLALYYSAWLIASLATYFNGKWFIFLTNWSFIMWITYLFVAAISVSFKFLQINLFCKSSFEAERAVRYTTLPDIVDPQTRRVGCCGREGDATAWYQKLQWVAYTVGAGMAVIVVVLYWIVIYRGEAIDGYNANSHLTNGLLALLDTWVSGTPVRFLHVVYLQMFCVIYTIFTVIYFAASDGDYIYSALDYSGNPGLAVVLVVVSVVVLTVLVYSLLYVLYVLRTWCIRRVRRCLGAPVFEPAESSTVEDNVDGTSGTSNTAV